MWWIPIIAVSISPITAWPYEKLFGEANLIIIGRPVSVRDAKPDEKLEPPAAFLAGVVTVFHIDHVVKGDHQKSELELVHFRVRNGAQAPRENAPMLVQFVAKPVKPRAVADCLPGLLDEPQYLMFLKKTNDGRWECVSGQINPKLSVKQLVSLPFE